MAGQAANRKRIVLPDAELAVLKVLWERQAATVREIMEALYPQGETSEYATVQKLLDRLQGRGCVTRQRRARAHVYTPAVDRDRLIREQLREAADRLCEGSLTPLLTQLVDAENLSPQDIRTLRALVERFDQEGPGREAHGIEAGDSSHGERSET